jgi:hypothetical protein
MTLMSAYLRLKAKHCRILAGEAEGWVIKALHEMADELDGNAAELEMPQP